MINSLTIEQKAKIPVYYEKWLKIGMNTEPFTLDYAKPIITNLYEKILEKTCPPIVILDNPLHCWMACVMCVGSQIDSQIRSQIDSQIHSQIYSQIHSQIDSQIRSQIDSQIRSQIYSQIHSQIYSQIYSQIRSQIRSQIGSQIDYIEPYLDGQLWAGYFGFYEFIFSELITCNCKKYNFFFDTVNLFQIYPLDNICVLCQRPTKLNYNSNLVLHNDSDAAVQFGNWGIYVLNGVNVPNWLVTQKDTEIDPALITTLKNAEQRREFVRKIGYDRIFYKLGGVVLDKKEIMISNGRSMFRHVYEVIRLNCVNWTVLKMINPSLSTPDNEVYHIEGLPPDCDTVEKAINFRKPEKMKNLLIDENGEDYYQHGDRVIWPVGAKSIKMYPAILT